MPSCSKAPWGLSVQSRVTCIFTGTSISPSPSLRQCPNRYAFRAGRNLPDKEFRYLRTVIVTAAVYRGFNSELSHFLLTFRHRAGVSTYISAFAFAGTCVYAKQSLGPLLCHRAALRLYNLHASRSSLFLSYGCNLPSSLTRVFSRTLEFSSCLPVSVLVRAHSTSLEAFLGSVVHATSTFPKDCLPISSRSSRVRDLPPTQPTTLDMLFHSHAYIAFCVTPSSNGLVWYRNFSRLSIAYASSPPLRARLTPGRRALPGKP